MEMERMCLKQQNHVCCSTNCRLQCPSQTPERKNSDIESDTRITPCVATSLTVTE
jgi:hypothetical protein